MVGLDTNVLVRYLTQDDPRQSSAATRLIETELSDKKPGFISLMVLVELCWVLERLYSARSDEIADTIADMLGTSHFQLQERESVQAALEQWRRQRKSNGAGLPDMLIAQVALKFGCTRVFSFDKMAVRTAGMTLLT